MASINKKHQGYIFGKLSKESKSEFVRQLFQLEKLEIPANWVYENNSDFKHCNIKLNKSHEWFNPDGAT